MTELDVFARAVGWSLGLGALTGWLFAAAVFLPGAGTEMGVLWGLLVVSALYGGVIGAVAGLLLGVTAVLIAMPVSSNKAARSVVAFFVAAGLPGVLAVLSLVPGRNPELARWCGVIAVAAGVSAWVGIGKVYRV